MDKSAFAIAKTPSLSGGCGNAANQGAYWDCPANQDEIGNGGACPTVDTTRPWIDNALTGMSTKTITLTLSLRKNMQVDTFTTYVVAPSFDMWLPAHPQAPATTAPSPTVAQPSTVYVSNPYVSCGTYTPLPKTRVQGSIHWFANDGNWTNGYWFGGNHGQTNTPRPVTGGGVLEGGAGTSNSFVFFNG